jgi:hypothetical protein
MSRPLVFNLVVSNVPGPQQPLSLLGRRIREIYPYVPLSPQNHAVSIGLISYDGRVFFGLAGDRDIVPDLDRLAESMDEALREQPAPRRRPAAKPKPKPKAKAKAKAKRKPKAKARAKPRAKAKPRPRAKPKAKAKAKAKPKPRARAKRRPASPSGRGGSGRRRLSRRFRAAQK